MIHLNESFKIYIYLITNKIKLESMRQALLIKFEVTDQILIYLIMR